MEIAKGNDLVLALNYEQMDAVGAIFNFNAYDISANRGNYYVLLESTGKTPKRVEARLKAAPIRPSTQNHLVISSAVAKGLEIEQQKKDIRILSVHQKIEDVDLDKL